MITALLIALGASAVPIPVAPAQLSALVPYAQLARAAYCPPAIVGHSLGGALAELDCLFMALNLPPDIAIKGVTFGTPRVGNTAWATLFDATISDFQRINNEKDIVPIVPGRFLGFSHVVGEVHIIQPNDAVQCPGDDDATDALCTIGTVPDIFHGNILNHLGPYQGIYMGTIYCT